MTNTYILPIGTASVLFPLFALLLLVPIAIGLYRRHGVMGRWRTLSLFGFLYYLLGTVCMTTVPLPRTWVDVCSVYARSAHPRWVPGNTVSEVWKKAGEDVSFTSLVVQNPAVWGALLNVVLLLPLGFFLRYHFRRGLTVTAATGFATSLFFELTQYTGIWGIYPCPYRRLDVDDLLFNTTGAVIGWLLARPLMRRLPPLDALDERTLTRHPVPLGRRALALFLDLVAFTVITEVLVVLVLLMDGDRKLWPIPLAGFAIFVALSWLIGATPGKRILRLTLVTTDGGRPTPGQLLIRLLFLTLQLLPLLTVLTIGSLLLPNQLHYWNADLHALGVTDPERTTGALTGFFQGAFFPGFSGPDWLFARFVCVLAVALPMTLALMVRRHPRQLGVHELVSGVRNKALPPLRPRGTHRRDRANPGQEERTHPTPTRTREKATMSG